MNFKKRIFPLLLTLSALAACKKNEEHCWQIYDALGNRLAIICNKTEDEISGQYAPYYDRADAPSYCWTMQVTGNPNLFYWENMTEKMINVYFPGYATKNKVPCGYCQKWSSREKGLYKPNGNFAYKPIKVEQYCGDTCTKLFVGKIVTIRETTDSLITVEFLQKL